MAPVAQRRWVRKVTVRICYTSTAYLPALGGVQLHAHNIIRELLPKHQIEVVSHWDENRTDWLLGTTLRAPGSAKSYEYEGVHVDQITLTRNERLSLLPHVLTYYALKRRAIERISSILASKIEPLAAGCDLIQNCRIGREGLSFASLKAARKLDIPFVLVPYHHPRWVGWNYRDYISLYALADGVIALTECEKHTLERLGVRSDRISVTGMGPTLADVTDGRRFRARFGLGSHPMILFLAQQFRYKGIASVLAAARIVWAREQAADFVFIGPPTPFSERLFRHVTDKRVLNLGRVDLQTKSDALAACDILCVPSTQESFGGVYTEAWALGKPVIGGSAPAIREVIDEGVDGYVVDQDARVIAERVSYLLDHPSLRHKMGEAGRRKLEANYSWNAIAEKTEAAYLRVLGAKTRIAQ
ncbi:MAG: glycosyltransferase family 4 protein [Chloroflexi bacterium]|nr:glycosyltransferase family 4 protein [Chloroflexota bacterium]